MEPIKTIKQNGLTAYLYQDENPSNPREEYDHLGTMYCFHRRYELGDDHNLSVDKVQRIAKSNDYISLPLYLYDHSGLSMSTGNTTYPFNCPWDSGMVGIIAVDRAAILKEYSVKRISAKIRKRVVATLQCEVAEYDHYLSGEVYGYEIDDSGGNHIDSCFGFYGYKYAVGEMESAFEYAVKNHCTLELDLTGDTK